MVAAEPDRPSLMIQEVPEAMRLRGNAAWCNDPDETMRYVFPYPVEFRAAGYVWSAPKKDGSATELGVGVLLTKAELKGDAASAWETGYLVAKRFTPDALNSTFCACEYVSRGLPGGPVVLSDYEVATVKNSAHLPFAEVCAPSARYCPSDNHTAFEVMGAAMTEVFTDCEYISAAEASKAPYVEGEAVAFSATATVEHGCMVLPLIGFLCIAVGLAVKVRRVLKQDDVSDDAHEGYLSIE